MRPLEREYETPGFEYPSPPEYLPEWAIDEALEWSGLDEFDILVKAEEQSGRQLDIEYVEMSPRMWGLHVAKGKKAIIYINSMLPLIWRRFALFHELYHLLNHKKGESFWMRTATPMTSFEHQADIFAWSVIWPEWKEGY